MRKITTEGLKRLQTVPKMVIFRDKYYSRFTKLYYFGIYRKLFINRAFTNYFRDFTNCNLVILPMPS